MTPIVAITGPTAVGKSSLADMLALRWGSEVLSADAMQYIHLSLVVVGVNQMLRILSQFNTSTTSITIRHLCV